MKLILERPLKQVCIHRYLDRIDVYIYYAQYIYTPTFRIRLLILHRVYIR